MAASLLSKRRAASFLQSWLCGFLLAGRLAEACALRRFGPAKPFNEVRIVKTKRPYSSPIHFSGYSSTAYSRFLPFCFSVRSTASTFSSLVYGVGAKSL